MPVSSGDPLRIKADTWNQVERLVTSGKIGATTAREAGPYSAAVVVRAHNGGTDLEADRVAAMTGPSLDPETVPSGRSSPLVELGAAAWHGSLGQLAITIDPIPAGKIGRVAVGGITTAIVDVVATSDRYASLDPADPTRLRSSDTGEIKLIGAPPATGVRLCLVHVAAVAVPMWQYKLTADYATANVSADLYRLDGTLYGTAAGAAVVTVRDRLRLMDDQLTNAEGWCWQTGSRFYAINAPCPT